MKIAVLLTYILLVPISVLYAGDTLSVLDAWILEAPPGMRVMAGYMTVRNDTADSHELTGISSTQFERVEMHRTIYENDQARMEKQEIMKVESGETLKFEPGGSHLMLFNPVKRFKNGDEIELTLILKNGSNLDANAQIRRHSEMQHKKHNP